MAETGASMPLSAISIREATLTDAAAIAVLSGQLGYASSETGVRGRLARMLPEEGSVVLVAELAGQLVGWAHVFTALRVESEPFAELGGLVVEASARHRGVGRRLVDACSVWAAGHGFAELRVRSNVVREETYRFYARLGFAISKSQLVLSRPLDH